MKNPRTRIVLLALLIFSSAAAYTYLNTVQLNEPSNNCLKSGSVELLEEEEQGIFTPDVHLVKLIIEKGKQLLPAS